MDDGENVIRLKLTPEQQKMLSSDAKALSSGKISIELFDNEKKIGLIKTFECSYYSDTCCV
jgi:hypothetical protein